MPTPQMVPSPTNTPTAPQTPDIAGYIRAAQSQGIASDEIYSHLKSLGYVDSSGKISSTKQSAPAQVTTSGTDISPANVSKANSELASVGAGLKDTFENGGQNVTKDITDIPAEAAKAGNTPLAKVAAVASGAGHVAGDVAQTAGGIIGSAISPFLPDAVKEKLGDVTTAISDKVNAIPGMTPEIAKSLGDVFNTFSLEGGAKGAPIAKDAAEAAAAAGGDAARAAGAAVGGAKDAAVDAATAATKGAAAKLSDAATTITPNMQTLIDRVKGDPKLAASTAADVQKYFKTANEAKGVTGASTPLDLAGGQFKTAMTKLRSNMNATGETMTSSLKPIANATVSGVPDILKGLQSQTADRLGAVYTPLSEAVPEMKGKSFAQSTAHLNDIIDGKVPSPFGENEGPLQSAPGRESLITSPSDVKKIADLHETLASLGENPTIQQIHDVVQRWQGDLYKAAKVGAAPIDSNVQGLMKQTIGQLNEAAKNASLGAEKEAGIEPGTYADAKAKYGNLADLQSNMSRRLGVGYKQAPSLIKKIFSPQNQGLNDAIKKLETETGVPVFDHATLADFAMRSVGDPRITSLLEKLQAAGATKGTLTSRLFDYISNKLVDHLNDPEGKALRKLGAK